MHKLNFSRRLTPLLFLGVAIGLLAATGCSEGPFSPPGPDFDAVVLQAMDRTAVPGLSLAILDGGRIASNRAFGVKNRKTKDPISEKTVFEACSLSKPVLAYAALTLVAEGRLDLDKPLVEYASEEVLAQVFFREKIEDDRVRRITPRLVMSHRTGFPNWRRGGKLTLLADPGERFGYSGEGFVFLQRVVEQTTGRPINDFVKERVFDPLGMTSSSYVWIPDYEAQAASPHSLFGEAGTKFKPKSANGAASLHTTSRDYALFVAALLQGPGLREDLRREMLTEQTVVSPGVGWGLGVGLEKAGGRTSIWHWGDNGDFKCFFLVDAKDRSGFVYFANGFSGLSLAGRFADSLLGKNHPALSSALMDEYDPMDSPIFDLLKAASAGDIEAGLRLFDEPEAKARGAGGRINESSLNNFGYALLGSKRIDDAVKVFELNVRLYPRSGNVYDSLAEALEKRGDIEGAVRNYELSLKFDPKNANAVERLKVLREKKE